MLLNIGLIILISLMKWKNLLKDIRVKDINFICCLIAQCNFINIINQNPEVQQKLGTDVKTNGIFSGNISVSNNTGEANISVPIKGTKGSGTAIIVGEKEFDKWNYEKIAVQVDETGEVIEINKVKE